MKKAFSNLTGIALAAENYPLDNSRMYPPLEEGKGFR